MASGISARGQAEGRSRFDQVPGNALGAYLDGATIQVYCNAQDATGDTMNDGEIVVHGSSGDATGYAMRGGAIYIEKDAGYRCGIHMKEYQRQGAGDRHWRAVRQLFRGIPGRGRLFWCWVSAGRTAAPVGNFCGTGMHGGRIYLRTTHLPPDLPAQVVVSEGTEEDLRRHRSLDETLLRPFWRRRRAACSLRASHYYVLSPQHQESLQAVVCQQLSGASLPGRFRVY